MSKSYFKVIVKANFCSKYPLSEHIAYTEGRAFIIAHQQSALYPNSQIVIEEWKEVPSHKEYKKVYYRGRTIYYSEAA